MYPIIFQVTNSLVRASVTYFVSKKVGLGFNLTVTSILIHPLLQNRPRRHMECHTELPQSKKCHQSFVRRITVAITSVTWSTACQPVSASKGTSWMTSRRASTSTSARRTTGAATTSASTNPELTLVSCCQRCCSCCCWCCWLWCYS